MINKFHKFSSIVLLILLITAKCETFAQLKLGLTGGYTYNSLTTSSGYFYDRNFADRGGFTVSALAGYQFNDWLAVHSELGYIQKNYGTFRTQYISNEYANITNGYLQLPIYANFSFGGKKIRGFVNAGAFFSYWLHSQTKGTTELTYGSLTSYDFNESVPFDSRRDNRFEFGLMGGAGIEFLMCDKIRLFAEARYYYSLTDMQKSYMLKQMPRYNNTIAIQIGCAINIF